MKKKIKNYTKLKKKDDEINELRKKQNKTKVDVSRNTSEAKSWSSFFDKGASRIKPTEMEMVLMAQIREEEKTRSEKESNIVLSGVKESTSEDNDNKESED